MSLKSTCDTCGREIDALQPCPYCTSEHETEELEPTGETASRYGANTLSIVLIVIAIIAFLIAASVILGSLDSAVG